MGLSQSLLKTESLEYLVGARNSYLFDTPTRNPTVSKPSDSRDIVRKCPRCDLSYNHTLLLFPATLMNCELRVVCNGTLELLTHELIFRDQLRNSLSWPLETIRWFGENANFFVFESGRRSPSGPGLFVFRCKRASDVSKEVERQIKLLVPFHTDVNGASSPLTNPAPQTSSRRRVQLRFNVALLRRALGRSSAGEQAEPAVTSSTDACPVQTDDSLSSSRLRTLTASSSTISYPVLLSRSDQDQPESVAGPASEDTQPENYRSLATALTSLYLSSSHLSGQYLIAAAMHQYVNQPNGLLVPPPSRQVTHYVDEPV
ncbi:Fibroblast growth factor receptor substrate 3 [Clonorchis sinensis]|uniref:Fibroblast growth factor receptor substrate 3 n=2 Tax=Clonorchis sinensis TaxID=79923 RepID=G7Y9N6_CLOSI|nr:Fibroblast growth factor receptor substrate 3 [Clonorchis sinensis]GAA49670.1 fibroblast growth factor receptor substrate 3 [Clonorchis sinensis]